MYSCRMTMHLTSSTEIRIRLDGKISRRRVDQAADHPDPPPAATFARGIATEDIADITRLMNRGVP